MAKVTVAVRLDPDEIAALDESAGRRGLTRSQWLGDAVRTTLIIQGAQQEMTVPERAEDSEFVKRKPPKLGGHRHAPAKLLAGSMAECTCGARRQAGRWYEPEDAK